MADFIITPDDLPADVRSNEMVELMLDGANAKAMRVAPCLISSDPAPTTGQLAEAKLVLVGVIKRWAETGAGSFQQQAAGPFSVTVDTRQRGGWNLRPDDIADLQAICGPEDVVARSISMAVRHF